MSEQKIPYWFLRYWMARTPEEEAKALKLRDQWMAERDAEELPLEAQGA